MCQSPKTGWESSEGQFGRVTGYTLWGSAILLVVVAPVLFATDYVARRHGGATRISSGAIGGTATLIPYFLFSASAAGWAPALEALLQPSYFISEWLPVLIGGAVFGSLFIKNQGLACALCLVP